MAGGRKLSQPFGGNKKFFSNAKDTLRTDFAVGNIDKQVDELEQNLNFIGDSKFTEAKGCDAVPGGNGEDNNVGYVVNKQIDNQMHVHNKAYIECDYVE